MKMCYIDMFIYAESGNFFFLSALWMTAKLVGHSNSSSGMIHYHVLYTPRFHNFWSWRFGFKSWKSTGQCVWTLHWTACVSGGRVQQHNASVRAAFVHVLGDLLQSVSVFLSAIIIFFKVSVLSRRVHRVWEVCSMKVNLCATGFVAARQRFTTLFSKVFCGLFFYFFADLTFPSQ